MTTTSAASTLGDSWNLRLPEYNERFEPRPMAQGVWFSPPSLATLDLPQGKVLMVVDDAIMALDLQRLLHEAGYRVVGPATTVSEIQRMIQRGDIDCAILDLDIDRRAPLPIADLLAFADVPFVYLTTGVLGPVPCRHRQRPVVEKPFTREILIAAVEKAMARPREVANDKRWPAGGSVVPWTRVYPPL
ncbi:MAG: response regulator [Rhodospirillales bacterium]|nr:response regulator [Rhodospirillales bacterium]